MSRELRLAAGQEAVKINLMRRSKNLDLSHSALQHLADAARQTVEWADYDAGGSLELGAILDGIRASDANALIIGGHEDKPDNRMDPAKMSAGMTPQERLTWARNNGIVQ